MPNLVGIGLSQVPTNSMLGGLAYQDPEHASIKNLDLKNLSQINSEIADTATDVFVYDTSKDSDGGAWRKRTTHTSWYNETLGTATRGTRKEFPAVAVIVAEQNFIKIYDGDDPDLPMWMVFNTIAGGNSQGMADRPMVQVQGNDKVVHMLNGILATGTKNEGSNYGQPVINFISEKVLRMDSQGGEGGEWMGNIAQRNDAIGYRSVDYDYVIAASQVNDIAMTVLPNAPIDDATGLPVPTIAVATNGGTSVIKDDGTVVDFNDSLGSTRPISTVVIRGNDIVHWNINNGTIQQFFDALNATTDSTNDVKYNYTAGGGHGTCENVSALLRQPGDTPYYIAVRDSKSIAAGAQSGMSVFVDGIDRTFSTNTHSIFDSRVAYITSNYNTGWMHGDIKGAFLSDTSTTNVTGSNLIDNGDFGTGNFTNWSTSGTTTPSISSGGALLTTGAADGAIWQNTSSEATSGKWVITWTVTSNSGGFFGLFLNNNGANGSGGSLVKDSITASGSYYYEGSITAVEFRHRGSSSGIIDNITLRRVEDDRSVNNKGLQVFGTVTKSVVATGAELVAYSGFSNSNYFEQPFNSAMQFGSTGDFSIAFWMKQTSPAVFCGIIDTGYNSSGNYYFLVGTDSNGKLFFRQSDNTGQSDKTSSKTVTGGQWKHIVCTRTNSGTQMNTFIDGVLDGNSGSANAKNITNPLSEPLTIGNRANSTDRFFTGSLALVRVSASVPSAEQVKKIYDDEKVLFQENAKATLYGSSDAVTALAFDDTTNLLYVGTSAGRSEFQGLSRINNTTDAVTTAISASNGFVAEQ